MLEKVDNEVIGHRFPLREDLTIKIMLPVNITAIEVDRISEFISSLCIEKQNKKLQTQEE